MTKKINEEIKIILKEQGTMKKIMMGLKDNKIKPERQKNHSH